MSMIQNITYLLAELLICNFSLKAAICVHTCKQYNDDKPITTFQHNSKNINDNDNNNNT